MSKGSRSRRRRKTAEQTRAQGQRPGDEPIRLDPGQLCGIAVISPAELPPGLDLDHPGVCALHTEHALIVIPEDQPQIIQPRPQEHALIALADRSGRRFTTVTTETDKVRRAISMWADGMSHNEDFAITQDTVIAYVTDWPVPLTRNPDLDGPPVFD